MQLILASQSPRRKELLGLFRLPFIVRVADIDESMNPGDPYNEVARVSRLKAEAVQRQEDDVVIAADTIVVCDGRVLGKPADAADAHRMRLHCQAQKEEVYRSLPLHRPQHHQGKAGAFYAEAALR